MAKTGLVPNPDEGPIENEIPDPPPEENNLISTSPTEPYRAAQRVFDSGAQQNEIPDPPPAENN